MIEKELTKQQLNAMNKKDLIYETSIELFRKYGYDHTSIKDIVKATGISQGAIYNYYKSKSDILMKFGTHLYEYSFNILEINEKNLNNPIQTIYNYILTIVKMFEEIGKDITNQLHKIHQKIWSDETFIENGSNRVTLYLFIEAAQKHGTFDMNISTEEARYLIEVANYGIIYRWCDNPDEYSPYEKARECLPRLLNTFAMEEKYKINPQ